MRVEHLDDLPLIGNELYKSELSTLLDTHFPDHGHWKGISGGKLAIGWLLYILSEADHRLSCVEDWSEQRLEILSSILNEPELRSLDFNDDRLGRLLDRYSDDDAWDNFERSLGSNLLQVYHLTDKSESNSAMNIVRSDSFNVPQFRQKGELFSYGYSKQRRSDLPFCKVMLAGLDPFSLPLAVEILKGSGTDVNYYLTVIKRVQEIFGEPGNLYVGDSQLGSMANRLQIHKDGDYYLSPLGRKQCSLEKLHKYLDQINSPIDKLPSIFTEKESKRKAGYFYEIKEQINAEQSEIKWEERRILVYSPEYAKGLVESFNNRLDEAENAIKALVESKQGRRNPKTLEQLCARVGDKIKRYKVEGYFEINCSQKIDQQIVQRHKNRAEEIRETITLKLEVKRKTGAIELNRKRLGWQIYATNTPEGLIDTADLVKCYRDEYRIEHLFDNFINRDVGMLPIYLKKEARIKGLIRLLSIAMRFSVMIQHQVRGELAKKGKELKGIYPGNKNRSTSSPTTPMLLRAFRGISVVWLTNGEAKIIQMTPLETKQEMILELLGVPDIYQRTLEVLKTQSNLRET